ncbi:MAG: YraN family protein [Labilithrix sp.]
MSSSPKRPTTTIIGRTAEDVAAGALVSAGFDILWRNRRLGPLELDIVAQQGELVAIVEVRFRGEGAFDGPLESMTLQKQRRLLRAARELWRRELRQRRDVRRVRIDVIAVTGDSVEWIKGAVTAD